MYQQTTGNIIDFKAPHLREKDYAVDLLHISAFRQNLSSKLDRPEAIVRTFLSSGTTSAAERSKSPFSERGLELYRHGSLLSFAQMLKDVGLASPSRTAGISLIPRVEVWPDSSLAQMVEWISVIHPTRYIELSDCVNLEIEPGQKPLWFFATGYQLVQLFDAHARIRLPEGSIVIETGGTKTQSRSVDRAELHRMITSIFQIAPDRIVSEYGMCELACQAYEWQGPKHRRFRFPSWVEIFRLGPEHSLLSEGRGQAVIQDRLRVDLPQAIVTDDIIELEADGCFQLIGRLQGAPLKGCSLLAEELDQADASLVSNANERSSGQSEELRSLQDVSFDSAPNHLNQVTEQAIDTAERLARNLRVFLSKSLSILAQEWDSLWSAKISCQSMLASMPQNRESWRTCFANALPESAAHSRSGSWLIVAPSNHSFASLYPLMVGCSLGLNLTLRLPRSANLPFLRQLTAWLASEGFTISLIEGGDLLSRIDEHQAWDNILFYGSNEVAQLFRNAIPAGSQIKIFGHTTSAAALTGSPSDQDLVGLLKDAFSLGQRGCFSTRVALVVGQASPEQVIKRLQLLSQSLLDIGEHTAWQINSYEVRENLSHWEFYGREHERAPLFLGTSLSKLTVPVDSYLADQAFVLPILFCKDFSVAIEVLRSLSALKILTVSEGLESYLGPELPQCRITTLGSAHILRWDGYYEGHALFSNGARQAT